MLVESLGNTDGKVLGSDEGFKLVSTGGEVIGTLLVGVDIITLKLDVGTDLGYLDGYFDSSNDENLEGLFL